MLPIKRVVVKNIQTITLVMVLVILVFSAVVQMLSLQQTGRQNAASVFDQVEQILDENSRELERVQAQYAATCLNDARTVAYILEYNPEALGSVAELRKIAADVEADEIHIFNTEGVIVSGTHPEYYGFSMDSGEQMRFFKPLLWDKSLELTQDITPNTANGRLVQYSALWSEDGAFIVQIGMYPSSVLQATEKNELSYIFSLLRAGVGYDLYAIDPDTLTVMGATVVSDVGRNAEALGLLPRWLASESPFFASMDKTSCYCMSRVIGGYYVVWASPTASLYRPMFINELLMLCALIFIALIMIYAVTGAMNRAVIAPTQRINEGLRTIQEEGDLRTQVDVRDSREFSELSDRINSMAASLLHTSELLEMSEKIKSQKEELERQREQLEAALERAEAASRAKSEFLFNMSHDIRTPMNAILGFTTLALESGDPETQREYLNSIDVSSKQLLDLLSSILELARIENHGVVIKEELVDFSQTCDKLCTVFDSDLKKKGLTLSVTRELKHPHLYMDSAHYSRIFLNLVGNAVKYTPPGGSVSISFRELEGDAPGACVIETVVEDSGIGMSGEFLDHAFEAFSRERTSTVSGLQGVGMGLPIAKRLVDLMHGAIAIESRQGHGTRVTVRISHRIGQPPRPVPEEQAKSLDNALFQGRRVLLAEDIDINALIATKLLSSRGLLVERAKDGVECVDMLCRAEAGYYDLILMDIQMPNMDGYTATRTIRALEDREKAAIPIQAMTANALQEDREKAIQSGMNGHIPKPLDQETMFRSIAQVLSGS